MVFILVEVITTERPGHGGLQQGRRLPGVARALGHRWNKYIIVYNSILYTRIYATLLGAPGT